MEFHSILRYEHISVGWKIPCVFWIVCFMQFHGMFFIFQFSWDFIELLHVLRFHGIPWNMDFVTKIQYLWILSLILDWWFCFIWRNCHRNTIYYIDFIIITLYFRHLGQQKWENVSEKGSYYKYIHSRKTIACTARLYTNSKGLVYLIEAEWRKNASVI